MIPDTIVVPLDGSHFAEAALPSARAFVKQTGARMILLRSCWDSDEEEAREYLGEVANTCADIDVAKLVDDKPPVSAIRRAVHESPGRMAWLTTHGRGRVRWALLGSAAEEVVRRISESVMLVGRHCRLEWPNNLRKMVLAVDGSTSSPTIDQEPLEWATALGLEVHVVSVVHPLDTVSVDETLDAIVGRMQEAGVHAQKCVLRNGVPAGTISDFADTVDADLIAMSSHARTGMTRVALGSVTMGVVGMAGCPVLVNRSPLS